MFFYKEMVLTLEGYSISKLQGLYDGKTFNHEIYMKFSSDRRLDSSKKRLEESDNDTDFEAGL